MCVCWTNSIGLLRIVNWATEKQLDSFSDSGNLLKSSIEHFLGSRILVISSSLLQQKSFKLKVLTLKIHFKNTVLRMSCLMDTPGVSLKITMFIKHCLIHKSYWNLIVGLSRFLYDFINFIWTLNHHWRTNNVSTNSLKKSLQGGNVIGTLHLKTTFFGYQSYLFE